tara:strand:- start:830 stop:1852 length:1023 start_codon:yes stop_codon:yes gene_type:complete
MMSSDQPILEVKNLETHFPLEEGTVVAVNGASFKVMPGKTLGIVGESGCGKSVAARSIMRILDKPGEIVGGEILFRRNMGESSEEVVDIASMNSNSPEIKSIRGGEIAYVFQEPMTSFSPVHTIGNQIIEAIRLHQNISKEGAREIAIHALNAVGIPLADRRLEDYSFQLSGGLRQRAMIAMTLVSNPTILIADEPTTALDVTNQAQLLELMSELQTDNGMAIVLITHDLGVIAEMADHVSVMYLGEVVESASVDDIFHNPQHPYTKALLKSIPKIRSNSSERLASISGTVPHPYDRPKGCAFGPRCDFFMPGRCDASIPVLQEVRPVHQVSCFLYDEGD